MMCVSVCVLVEQPLSCLINYSAVEISDLNFYWLNIKRKIPWYIFLVLIVFLLGPLGLRHQIYDRWKSGYAKKTKKIALGASRSRHYRSKSYGFNIMQWLCESLAQNMLIICTSSRLECGTKSLLAFSILCPCFILMLRSRRPAWVSRCWSRCHGPVWTASSSHAGRWGGLMGSDTSTPSWSSQWPSGSGHTGTNVKYRLCQHSRMQHVFHTVSV